MFGVLLTSLVATTVRAVELDEALQPAQLQAILATPAAVHYQQQLQALQQRDRYQGELDALITETQLPVAAREWLLHELTLILREQTPTTAGYKLLQTLQQSDSQALLWHDFEGRQRALKLVPLASAARVTEQQWQIRALVQQHNRTPTLSALQTVIADWPQLSAIERQSWQQALQQAPTFWQPLLAQLPVDATFAQAPALAITAASIEPSFVSVVLQQGEPASASALLAELSNRPLFSDQDWQWLTVALARPALQSQAWFAIGKRSAHDPVATQRLRAAVEQGDHHAAVAWVTAQGDAALPDLQRQLRSTALPAQKAALLGLRLLNSPGAQATLRAAKNDPHLPSNLRQELQP